MSKRNTLFFVADMLVAIDLIQRTTDSINLADDFLTDETASTICSRELEIIGEAMKYVLEDPLAKPFHKEYWRKVVDFRNVVSHEYFNLNYYEMFEIIKDGPVDELEEDLIGLLQKWPNKAELDTILGQLILDLQKIKRQASIEYIEDIKERVKS